MKVCITSQENNLHAHVDPHFGRCRYFIIVDDETMEFEAIANPSLQAKGGAGIQAAQLVSEKEVAVVLSGNVGPNAFETLEAAGIKVITGVSGNVRAALEQFKSGSLEPAKKPSVGSKFGATMIGE